MKKNQKARLFWRALFYQTAYICVLSCWRKLSIVSKLFLRLSSKCQNVHPLQLGKPWTFAPTWFFAIALTVATAVRIVSGIRLLRDEEMLKKKEIAEKDERNLSIVLRAKGYTFGISVFAACIAILVLALLKMQTELKIVSYCLCFVVVVYYFTYRILQCKGWCLWVKENIYIYCEKNYI